ncbi:hypothetical protein A1F94_010487 [Pyrenophora tritici-repentis]|uniref:MARVEL domain-containing protein n=1 Tax=Pyrenophora tritici-repentis TaxID=45151 RepID=A0A317BNA1_9PLEO|nr:hypothetical protein A1F94_010487 [Pyrenophora tritici-repentis]KAI0577993.1 hypothetical protein Alg130_08123 [Pyrenophora tritici-repentis]KAI0609430.1 hypothetical protein TUN205_06323 [Pyrenophora tritici-repentis]KAI0622660.1 hypothetical protein TUN199_05342 [Pyrenophora tritici-repentis]KAI1508720.1 hypothetical protein Ptr86124_012349 [Pyrenophora tritici-repentis]
MPHLKSLLPATFLRALQLLLGIITLGLSVTLLNRWAPSESHLPGPPILLPLSAGIGGVTLIGAILGLILAWTELLLGYFQVSIDIVVLLANVVGGVLLAMRLQGKNCFDTSRKNKWGSGEFPFKGSLAGIDILNGGCDDEYCYYVTEDGKHLNTRCKQSQADSEDEERLEMDEGIVVNIWKAERGIAVAISETFIVRSLVASLLVFTGEFTSCS